MKNLIRTVFFKLLSTIFLAVAGMLILVYCFQFMPAQKKLLRAGLFEKVRTVFSLSGGTLTKALQTHDDIMMLTTIESIMKIEDISAVYIMDNGCKVITHDKTSEWGKVYSDEQSKNAVASKKLLRQTAPAGFLFSEPLTSSTTLCVAISSQKLEDSISALNKEIFFSGLIIFIIAAAGFFWLIYNMLRLKVKKLGEGLKSLELGGSGRLPEDGPDDEFGRLTKAVNAVLDTRGRAADSGPDTRRDKSLGLLVRELAEMNPGAVIIVGNDNKIAAINRGAAEFAEVSTGEALDKHILDVIKLPGIIALVKQASEKPGSNVEALIKGRKVKAATAAGEAGIIIEIEA